MKPSLIESLFNNTTLTVADHKTGPEWIARVMIIFAILSVVLLSGRGSFLIAGYNTASQKEKARYDQQRLCRVMGTGLGCITVSFVFLFAFQHQLSDRWIEFEIQFVIVVVIIMIVVANTWCKKK